MEFRKKLKTRLYTAISYVVFGLLMIGLSWWKGNDYLSSLGLCFTVMGIARVVQYCRITKSDESIKQREISETDERNVKLWKEARSLAFSLYLLLSCCAVIVLQLLNRTEAVRLLGLSVFALVALYWFCYAYVRKKY